MIVRGVFFFLKNPNDPLEGALGAFASFLGNIESIVDHDIEPFQPYAETTKGDLIAAMIGDLSLRSLDIGVPPCAMLSVTLGMVTERDWRQQIALGEFLSDAQEVHTKANRSAEWWAVDGIEPLWKTLLGENRSGNDTDRLPDGEAQRRFDLLTGVKAIGLAAEPLTPPQRETQSQPLPSDIRDTIAPDVREAKLSLYSTEHGICRLCTSGARLGDKLAVMFRSYGEEVAMVLREYGMDNIYDNKNTYAIVSMASVPSNWEDLLRAQRLFDKPKFVVIK